jgi:hypothetical protein
MISVLYDDYSYLNEVFDDYYKENKSKYISISRKDCNKEAIKELIKDTVKIVNNNHFKINPSNYHIEFHKYIVNDKTKPFFDFHEDDGGAVYYNTITCIYYLEKDNTIEGGDLEFKKYNIIKIESNMLVIFNGNLTHRATIMNGNGIRKSIVIQFERL